MKQKQKIMDLEQTLSIFDAVCSAVIKTDGALHWNVGPEDIIMSLLKKAVEYNGKYVITYNNASRIIDTARSSKLTKFYGRGIDIIKEKWRHSYVGEI